MSKYYRIKLCSNINGCEYGSNCKYAHGLEEIRCKFYQEGKCEKNEKCKYIHEGLKQNILPIKENENIKTTNNSIEFNINVEELKNQNEINWADDYSMNSELSKKENKEDKKIENEDTLNKCINKLKEYENYLFIKDQKLDLIPDIDIFLEKLYIDLDNSKKTLEMLLERYH